MRAYGQAHQDRAEISRKSGATGRIKRQFLRRLPSVHKNNRTRGTKKTRGAEKGRADRRMLGMTSTRRAWPPL